MHDVFGLSNLVKFVVVVVAGFLHLVFRSTFRRLCHVQVVSLAKVLCLGLMVDEVFGSFGTDHTD
jgi:hypothetical protein